MIKKEVKKRNWYGERNENQRFVGLVGSSEIFLCRAVSQTLAAA
jgi:hypothetical protein